MTGEERSRELGAAAISAVLAGVSVVALWQASEFSAFGSIFPIVIASSLLVGVLVVLVRSLVAVARATSVGARDTETAEVRRAGLVRSLALIAVLVAWVAALEWTGFLVTSWAGFVALALIADAERPTVARTLLYAGVALAVVGGLQLLFQHGLKVRLPEGDLLARIMGG